MANCTCKRSKGVQSIPEKPEFWVAGIINLCYFADITVNHKHYRSMFTKIFWPEIDNLDTKGVFFQQVRIMCDTTNDTLNILNKRFVGIIISCGGDVNCPPKSCDSTILNLFLSGLFKLRLHA